MTHNPQNPTPEPNMTSIGITLCGKNQLKTRSTIEIGARQSGQPLSIAETVSAQLPQNLEWPHDTRTLPEHGEMTEAHITEFSSIGDGVWKSRHPHRLLMWTSQSWRRVHCAGSAGAASMSSLSSSVASGANWNASVCAPRLVMARENCFHV